MRVKVKLVVFRHPEPAKWGTYCSYCPEIKDFFGRGETVEDVVLIEKQRLFTLLCNRFKYKNLQKLGWTITENSVIPPIFTPEEALFLTEESYNLKLDNYKILEIDVEVPFG